MATIRRARLIYNPTSGREEMRRRLPEVLRRLEKGGYETSAHMTEGEGDALLAAKEAVRRKYDLIIAAGGDGTLNEVVNGMAEQPNRPALGLLPLGTTNDFARALRIPRQWDKAIDVILNGRLCPIDVGKVNHRYFINICGGGSMTELTYEVPSKLKTMLGQLAYYMKGIEKLPRFRPIDLTIHSEEYSYTEKVMLFLITNSNSVGGFEKLVPDASLNDGLLNVIVLRKCMLHDFVRIVSLAARGEHLDDPHFVHFTTRHIEISSPDYTQMNVDGEYGGTLPVTVSVLPAHIRMFCEDERLDAVPQPDE